MNRIVVGYIARAHGVRGELRVQLHDPESEKSVAIVFFETEDDYQRGDEILSAMPAGDTSLASG